MVWDLKLHFSRNIVTDSSEKRNRIHHQITDTLCQNNFLNIGILPQDHHLRFSTLFSVDELFFLSNIHGFSHINDFSFLSEGTTEGIYMPHLK
uniref:Uncharacterized protein n=1 Tax=Noccaea caerulescens TaxID=107243 RepID=A0A1J3H7E6_NOCCA